MIRIIYNGNQILVKFEYQPEVVTIMKMFGARYFWREKYWYMPVEKAEELVEELTYRDYDFVEVNKDSWSVKREGELS